MGIMGIIYSLGASCFDPQHTQDRLKENYQDMCK